MWKYINYIMLIVIMSNGSCAKAQSNSSKETVSLQEINQQAKKIKALKSFLMSRNGKLVGEFYFRSHQAKDLAHMRSATKSIISLLIGIAVDQKKIQSIDDPITKYLKGLPGLETRHANITVRHLLTMTSGFRWDESSAAIYDRWVMSGRPIRFLLDRKIVNTPGKKFEYNSAGTHLLSVLLTQATGMSTLKFAQRYLFTPLGIEKVRWEKLGNYYNGGAGLELRPRDMLKLGELLLYQGKYQSKTIISKQWMQASVKDQVVVKNKGSYGLLWWIAQEKERLVAALGFGGQMIVVFPASKVILVTTAHWQHIGTQNAVKQQRQISKMIGDYVLPFIYQ
ncbi:MAG TPA: penicillin-binding protein [Microscillaceae bacterium]|nr:penicillin-binding protein [Microscillaceae bacterium]